MVWCQIKCGITLNSYTSDTFRNNPKLSSISEIPEAPRPAWNFRPPGKDGGANPPGAQDNAGTKHEGLQNFPALLAPWRNFAYNE